jgi:hypothetical protein
MRISEFVLGHGPKSTAKFQHFLHPIDGNGKTYWKLCLLVEPETFQPVDQHRREYLFGSDVSHAESSLQELHALTLHIYICYCTYLVPVTSSFVETSHRDVPLVINKENAHSHTLFYCREVNTTKDYGWSFL